MIGTTKSFKSMEMYEIIIINTMNSKMIPTIEMIFVPKVVSPVNKLTITTKATMIEPRIRKAEISPNTKRHRKSELPSLLKSFQGLLTSALSWTILSMNINLPLELTHVRIIMTAKRKTIPTMINANQKG
jgi:hypothetical protein